MYETNRNMIERRTGAGLDMLREVYRITETDIGTFGSLMVAGRRCIVRQYEIEGVGNLLVMTCPEEGPMQMDTFMRMNK